MPPAIRICKCGFWEISELPNKPLHFKIIPFESKIILILNQLFQR